MAATDNFRRQHNDLLGLVGEIQDLASSPRSETASIKICRILSRMSGKLSIHLAAEDKSLYPRLVASDDAGTSEVAKRFQEEMSGLGDVYNAFAAKWRTPQAIDDDFEGFVAESGEVFAALGDRIARENRELYPLADKS